MIPVNLDSNSEKNLRRQASQLGQDVEAYLRRILETGGRETASDNSDAAFERALDQLSEGFPPCGSLPADFSRADIYNDHD